VNSSPAQSGQRAGSLPNYSVVVIVVAVVLAWSNSFPAPFLLDDYESIVSNPTIRDLASLAWLRPPSTMGETVSGRPVLNFSFALNYALSGLDVRGYRAVNVLLHVISACLLFGLSRRTLAKTNNDQSAVWLALTIALIWALHPLQTAAVTYVVQRAESLAGLFALLTLYAFARGSTEPRGWRWMCVAWIASLLGMGTKETAAVVPLVVLLYDRAFVSLSFRAAFHARGRFYLLLGATWLLLIALVWTNAGRGGSAGFGAAIGSWTYFATQCEAIVRYLTLFVWPGSQVFDYGVHTVEGLGDVLPQFFLLCALAIGVIWALWRNQVMGFLGACFFLGLAPSSSFIPVATQTVAEHRVYLALAPLVVAVCLGVRELLKSLSPVIAGRLKIVVAAAVIVTLGGATFARNQVYRSELALWQDTVAKRPQNPRAQNNLGVALLSAARTDEAATAFRKAVQLQPNHAFAHFNLGSILITQGRREEAVAHFTAALEADPQYASARVNLARALEQLGRTDEAIAQFRTAADASPDPETHFAMGALLAKQRRIKEAARAFEAALAINPDHVAARANLANCQLFTGDVEAAIRNYEAVLRARPGDEAVRKNLEVARELRSR
jgi:Flp pilus assembly protein TadD